MVEEEETWVAEEEDHMWGLLVHGPPLEVEANRPPPLDKDFLMIKEGAVERGM